MSLITRKLIIPTIARLVFMQFAKECRSQRRGQRGSALGGQINSPGFKRTKGPRVRNGDKRRRVQGERGRVQGVLHRTSRVWSAQADHVE